jgi:hypothetical protein
MRDLHKRSREITDEIAAIVSELGFRKTLPKTGEVVRAWRTYHDAVIHQNRVRERAVVIAQLRRGIAIVPSLEEMFA